MKTTIILAIVMLLAGCSTKGEDNTALLHELQQAEEVAKVDADSALLILQAMPEDEALPYFLQASESLIQTKNHRLGNLYERAIGTIYKNHNDPKESWNHLQKAFNYALQTNDTIIIASTYEQITSLMGGNGRNFYKDFASVRNMKESPQLNLNDFPFNPDSVQAFDERMKQFEQRMSEAYPFDIDSILKTSDVGDVLISDGVGLRESEHKIINDNTRLQNMGIKEIGIVILTIFILIAIVVYKVKMHSLEKNAEIKRYRYQIKENNKLIAQNQLQIVQLKEQINEKQNVIGDSDESHQAKNEELYNRNLYYTEQIITLVPDFKKLKDKPRTLTETEIMSIKQKVNLHFDTYIDRLKAMAPSLTDGDLEICALIKIGFNIKDISIILNIDSASVSTRKYRMQKRIIENISTFEPHKCMDDWLRSL